MLYNSRPADYSQAESDEIEFLKIQADRVANCLVELPDADQVTARSILLDEYGACPTGRHVLNMVGIETPSTDGQELDAISRQQISDLLGYIKTGSMADRESEVQTVFSLCTRIKGDVSKSRIAEEVQAALFITQDDFNARVDAEVKRQADQAEADRPIPPDANAADNPPLDLDDIEKYADRDETGAAEMLAALYTDRLAYDHTEKTGISGRANTGR